MIEHHNIVFEARVRELLEAYGGSPEAWPAHEREAALGCIARSKTLQKLQQEAAALDELLAEDRGRGSGQACEDLAARIVSGLPARQPARSAARPGWLRAPALAAGIAGVAVLVLAFVLRAPQEPAGPEPGAFDAFEHWAWSDVTDEPLPAATKSEDLDFMGLVELETEGA